MMMYSVCLLLTIFAWNIAAQSLEGSGGMQSNTNLTSCSENEKNSVFYFSTLENRCIENLTCSLVQEEGTYSTRELCEEHNPATECEHPSAIKNGFYYISRSKDGTVTAHYACFKYYKIDGLSERQCQYNEEWSGEEPYCKLIGVPCDPSPDVEGAIKRSCTSPGCYVMYSCKKAEGWELVSGKGYRECGMDGQWINDLPVCARLRMMQDDSEVNSEIKATDGQTNFEVQCLVEPIVPPQAIVQWTRNGKVNNNTHWKSDHRSLALNFDRVEYNDAGEYKCMMELENHIERSIDFVVISPANDVTVNLLFKFTLFLSPYNMFEFNCVFEASTKPTVKWYFNGEMIELSNKHLIFDRIGLHSRVNFNVLQVMFPSTEDLGVYHCEANDDPSTQQLFEEYKPESGALSKKARRSLGTQESTVDEIGVLSKSAICSDDKLDIFIGRFRREIKQKEAVKRRYILRVERYLGSVPPPYEMLVDIEDVQIIPTNLSFRELYSFIVRNDKGRRIVLGVFPYDEQLETVIDSIC